MRPGLTHRAVGRWSCTFIFIIPGSFLTVGVAPIVPAFGRDAFTQIAFFQQDIGPISPGPAQILVSDGRIAGETASVEHIAVRMVRGGRSRSEIALSDRVDVAFFEPNRSRTEDKVHSAFNIAVPE